MRDLEHYIDGDERGMKESRMTEEEFRFILDGAAEIFRQPKLRDAFPIGRLNDFGIHKIGHYEEVDMAGAEWGMRGTGGSFDQADKKLVEIQALAIWRNWEVLKRDYDASLRGGAKYNLLVNTGRMAAEKVLELENEMLATGLGPNKGITNATGIQTFAGASWTNTGVAFDDLVKAIDDKLGTKGAPKGKATLLVNHAEMAKLKKKQVGTANFGTSFAEIESLCPGGVFAHDKITAGKAYVFAGLPTVVEYVLVQDLTNIPLPMIDEDFRGRVRVAGGLDVKKADGVVEITGIA